MDLGAAIVIDNNDKKYIVQLNTPEFCSPTFLQACGGEGKYNIPLTRQ
jgi:hypothetical protein